MRFAYMGILWWLYIVVVVFVCSHFVCGLWWLYGVVVYV